MMLDVGVEQSTDHALVLRVVFARFSLKVVHASLAQCYGYFDSFISKDKLFRARQEIRNDPKISEGFVCIFYFPVHRFAYLSASNRLQKYESRRYEQ